MKKNFVKIILIIFLLIGSTISAVFATNTVKSSNNTTNETNYVSENEAYYQNNSQNLSEMPIGNVTSTTQTNETYSSNNLNGLGLIAVALATGLACIGAGIAVATVGASAVGAISENPKLLGKTIIFAGLAEGIAIYGLIISIMILNKI